MVKRLLLVGMSAVLCTGVTCTITWPGGSTDAETRLSQADAQITISREVGVSRADAVAIIQDSWGRTVTLSEQQAVLVNDVELAGPTLGQYTALVAGAGVYTVTVRDPTRGEEETTIAAPGDFEITSPTDGGGVSLSGFTLVWSNVSSAAEVMIKLSQIRAGVQEIELFGPVTDTGSYALTASDLRDFRQGSDLTITVTKSHAEDRIAGFGSGELVAEVSVRRTTEPLP